MRVSYASSACGAAEWNAVRRVLRDPAKLVAGPSVARFEHEIASLFGKRHGVMVNSGSSANLLALSLLDFPPGSEVITPALTFSTTVAPILQRNLVPVLVDVDPGTYVVNPDQAAGRITKRTVALMIPSLIGNLPDLARLQRVARSHRLVLIEDSCDTLGARFGGKPSGAYSDLSTTSFYASHIITAAGAGGMLCVDDASLARRARVMSYWGRDSTLFGAYEQSEDVRKRFAGVLDGEPYDAKFVFSEVGYNLQPTELQGAFGLVQLRRLPRLVARRRAIFGTLVEFFRTHEDRFVLPRSHPSADSTWLAFPLTLRPDAGFTRIELARHLEARGIQTRPIFTGNVLAQPGFHRHLRGRPESFPGTNAVMRGGLLIGCHPGMTARHLDYLRDVFGRFLRKH